MYETILSQTGLTEEQASIYEALLTNGALKASKISEKTRIKRGFVYFLLEQLIHLGLVEEHKEQGKATTYKPLHPYKLKDLAEKREEQAKDAELALQHILPQLVSNYNLIAGKPHVRFFEGKEGIIKIYEELLNENAPIDSIEDKGEMTQFFPEYIPSWVKRRIQRQIVNRAISPTGNPINWTDPSRFLYSRNIPLEKYPLSIDVKIVNNKVSLVTFQKETAVGIIIDHPEIANNFRLIFKFMWDVLGETAENKAVHVARGHSMLSNILDAPLEDAA